MVEGQNFATQQQTNCQRRDGEVEWQRQAGPAHFLDPDLASPYLFHQRRSCLHRQYV